MFWKSVNISLFFCVLAILAFSCSNYEKLLKSDDYNLKFKEAFAYYDKGDYLRSATIFDQIAPVFRGTKRADSAYYFQAMSYFKQNDYIMSGHYFKLFSETFGNSPFLQDAAFYEAYCYYLSSPRPELDQANTHQAIATFQLFVVHYPKSEHVAECQTYITELKEKLMQKSFMGAKTYFDLEDYKASVTALNSSLVDFPETKYREDIMFLIVKSNYLYAVNSIETRQPERFQDTIDDYYSFIAEFPTSKYLKEASRMYDNSSHYLKTRNIEELKQ